MYYLSIGFNIIFVLLQFIASIVIILAGVKYLNNK